MKIAFVGKGGSGKTTTSSLFVQHLASYNHPVVAIDADINQHLADALGIDQAVPALGEHLPEIKTYLRGTNPRISSADTMTKTTPPGHGSRLLRINGDDPFHKDFAITKGGITFMATGGFTDEDLGVSCFHSKTGAVELYLNHLVDQPEEYVIVDMTAGADAFASGLFAKFDVTFLVAEPTIRSIGVYRQYKQYAADHQIKIKVIGNKVQDADDETFLRDAIGDDLLACMRPSAYVRACEKGHQPDFVTLEPSNRTALETLLKEVNSTEQNWPRFTRQTHAFHAKNALKWANGQTGEDLTKQIDPDFAMSSEILQ